MLKFGIVTDVDPAKARVRVKFEDDDIASDWLPVIQSGSLKNKAYALPDPNEQVACMMDERAENGVVVGSTYNSADAPGFDTADKIGTKYEDGTEIYYDRSANEYVINSTGKVKITAATQVEVTCEKMIVTGDVEITGSIDATGGIKATGVIESDTDVKAVTVSLLTHIHSGVTPGGGTTAIPVP